LKHVGPMLRADLERSDLPAIFAPKQLVLRFAPGYNRQCQACSDPLRVQRIEDSLLRVTAEPWKIRCELRNPTSTDPIQVEESAKATPNPEQQPLLEKIQSALRARLLRVDDGFGIVESSAPATTQDEPEDPEWADQEE
jgi:hypothetical protein